MGKKRNEEKNLIIINFFLSLLSKTLQQYCGNGMKCSTTKIFFKEVKKIFNGFFFVVIIKPTEEID